MPWVWKMVHEPDTEFDKKELERIPRYEPGEMDYMPIDFVKRTKRYDGPEAKWAKCIIFLYMDGSTPRRRGGISQPSFPTYKGKPPKRAAAHTIGNIVEGAVINQMCGNIFCVNQKHLHLTGSVIK